MERRKKILIIITKSVWGGAQRYVYDLATNLNKEIFDIVVALGGDGPLKTKLEEVGVRIIPLQDLSRDIKVTSDLKVFNTLRKIFRTEKPDLIHLNSSKIGGLGALAGRLAGVPKIIFTLHGLAFNEDRGSISKAMIKVSYWLTFIMSHNIIAVSDYVKNRVGSWPMIGRKIGTIHNGISEINFSGKSEARKTLLPESVEKSVWIGTIAELHPIKGHRYLIEALAGLSDLSFKLVIIGEGEERESLEKLITEKNLKNKVFLVGHKDNAASFLKAFDLFTFTSISEGLGYALLEAGLASLPVIATRTGGVPEVIENHKDGLLVTPRRSNEIRQAFIYLDEHHDEVKSFGENLRKKVLDKFSLKKMVEETEKIYKN